MTCTTDVVHLGAEPQYHIQSLADSRSFGLISRQFYGKFPQKVQIRGGVRVWIRLLRRFHDELKREVVGVVRTQRFKKAVYDDSMMRLEGTTRALEVSNVFLDDAIIGQCSRWSDRKLLREFANAEDASVMLTECHEMANVLDGHLAYEFKNIHDGTLSRRARW